MNKPNFTKEQTRNAWLGLVVAIILFILYQNQVAIPRERQEAEREANANAEREYKLCKGYAYIDYSADWDMACETAGKAKDCTHPTWKATELNDRLADKERVCLEVYKAQLK